MFTAELLTSKPGQFFLAIHRLGIHQCNKYIISNISRGLELVVSLLTDKRDTGAAIDSTARISIWSCRVLNARRLEAEDI